MGDSSSWRFVMFASVSCKLWRQNLIPASVRHAALQNLPLCVARPHGGLEVSSVRICWIYEGSARCIGLSLNHAVSCVPDSPVKTPVALRAVASPMPMPASWAQLLQGMWPVCILHHAPEATAGAGASSIRLRASPGNRCHHVPRAHPDARAGKRCAGKRPWQVPWAASPAWCWNDAVGAKGGGRNSRCWADSGGQSHGGDALQVSSQAPRQFPEMVSVTRL